MPLRLCTHYTLLISRLACPQLVEAYQVRPCLNSKITKLTTGTNYERRRGKNKDKKNHTLT